MYGGGGAPVAAVGVISGACVAEVGKVGVTIGAFGGVVFGIGLATGAGGFACRIGESTITWGEDDECAGVSGLVFGVDGFSINNGAVVVAGSKAGKEALRAAASSKVSSNAGA